MAGEYCTKEVVKDRMLIAANDTQYDTPLDQAIEEASRMIDIFLIPYEDTLPLNEATPQIAQICGDFAASIFKRRMVPGEVIIRGALQPNPMDIVSEMDASGWFGIGIRKLELYIKGYYTLAQTVGNTVHNPDIWVSLFEKGIVTGLEARKGINDATEISLKRIEDITKTTNETKILDESITRQVKEGTAEDPMEKHQIIDEYHTKRQKSFAFIEGDKNGGYKEQEE